MSPVATAAAPQRIPRRSQPRVTPEVTAPGIPSRHLQLVDSAVRRRARMRRWMVRGWAVGIVAAALLGVMVHAMMAEAQMQVDRIDGRIKAEQSRYEEVRLRVAELGAPDAIVTRALQSGLIPAPTTRNVPTPGPGSPADVSSAQATADWQETKQALGSNP